MEKKISESRPPSDVGDFLGPQLDSCYLLSKYSKAHEFTIDTIVISYLYHIYIIFISYLYLLYPLFVTLELFARTSFAIS